MTLETIKYFQARNMEINAKKRINKISKNLRLKNMEINIGNEIDI